MAAQDILQDAGAVVNQLDRAVDALRGSHYRQHSIDRIPARGRLLVTGDLHDNPIHYRGIVELARLDASPDNHVVLHEIIHGETLVNGLDMSHRMLVRVAGLISKHPGQVHLLLANHELAQMTRSGVTKGGGDSVALFDQGLEFVFGDRWIDVRDAVERLIAALPLALVTESGVLCAHSLPRRADRFDAGVLARDLTPEDYRSPGGAAYRMVWGRGYDAATVDMLAGRWGVELFCLGHEKVDNGIEMRGPRVIVLNSDHEMATVVGLDLTRPPSAEEMMFAAIRLRAVVG